MTSKDNKTSMYTEEVTTTKKTTSATSMVMNLSEKSNREPGRESKAKSSDDDVMRRFLDDRDHVMDRLHRGSGDHRNAGASAEGHNAGVREKTEEYAKVIEQKACRM